MDKIYKFYLRNGESYDVRVKVGKYPENDTTSLELIDNEDGITLLEVTVNIPQVELDITEILLNPVSARENVIEFLVENSIVAGRVKRYARVGSKSYPIRNLLI